MGLQMGVDKPGLLLEQFPINSLVEAHSLRKSTGLNCEHGRVCEARDDRIVVSFERGLGLKALMADNSRFVPSPPSRPEDEENVELRRPPLPPPEDEGNAHPDPPPPPPPIQPWQLSRGQQDEVDAHQQQANTFVIPLPPNVGHEGLGERCGAAHANWRRAGTSTTLAARATTARRLGRSPTSPANNKRGLGSTRKQGKCR